MSQQQFGASLKFVMKWEGSAFTNDPDDMGGATRYGVTQRVYDGYRQRQGKPLQSVKFITEDEYGPIYRNQYWNAVQGDSLPSPLDTVLFDTGVLMGPKRAIMFLQASLGVETAGVFGPKTRAALAAANGVDVTRKVLDRREKYLYSLVEARPNQKKFLKGWLNRLNDLRKTVGLAAAESAEVPSDEEVSNEGDDGQATTRVSGRAEWDSPEDEDFSSEGGTGHQSLGWLIPTEPAAFLAAANAGNATAYSRTYVLDISLSSPDVMVVFQPDFGPRSSFQIPAAALESIAPLGVFGVNPKHFLVQINFHPDFAILASAFDTLGGSATPTFSGMTRRQNTSEDDPAAPGQSGGDEDANSAKARELANFGSGEDRAERSSEASSAESANFPFPTLALDMSVAHSFLAACISSSPRVAYGLGAKVPFLGAVPGRDFKRVDCSGFVREAIRRSTSPHIAFPDGSVVQHDWVRTRGFKNSTIENGKLQDGVVRIAFLRPQDAPSGVGHVVLIHNGATLESHGGLGPDTRPWTGGGWQSKAIVYVLTAPAG